MGGLIAMHWMAHPRPWDIPMDDSVETKASADSSVVPDKMLPSAAPVRPAVLSLVLNDIGAVVPSAALRRIAGYVGKPPVFPGVKEAAAYISSIYGGFGPCGPGLRSRMAAKVLRLRVTSALVGGVTSATGPRGGGGDAEEAATPVELAQLQTVATAAACKALQCDAPIDAPIDADASGNSCSTRHSSSGQGSGQGSEERGKEEDDEQRLELSLLSLWNEDSAWEEVASTLEAALEAARESVRGRGNIDLELAYDPGIAANFGEPSAIDKDADMWGLFGRMVGGPLLVLRGAESDILSAECAM